MKFHTCINHGTILTTPVEKAIIAADKAGFEGFDFQEKDLDEYVITRKKKVKKLVNLFDSTKIKPVCFTGLHRYMPNYMFSTDEEFEKEKKKVIPLFEALKALDVKTVISPELGRPVVPSIDKVWSYQECFENTVKRNRQLADMAKKYDIEVSFEYLGGSNFVNSAKRAMAVINQVRRENFGLALDTYHMYKAGEEVSDLEEIPEGSILTVHLANVLDIPRDKISDFDREYLLEGKLDLVPFLGLLRKKKYDGYLSIELFRENEWKDDPLKIAKLAYESVVNLISKYEERGER